MAMGPITRPTRPDPWLDPPPRRLDFYVSLTFMLHTPTHSQPTFSWLRWGAKITIPMTLGLGLGLHRFHPALPELDMKIQSRLLMVKRSLTLHSTLHSAPRLTCWPYGGLLIHHLGRGSISSSLNIFRRSLYFAAIMKLPLWWSWKSPKRVDQYIHSNKSNKIP